jgi:hypothetical protein
MHGFRIRPQLLRNTVLGVYQRLHWHQDQTTRLTIEIDHH